MFARTIGISLNYLLILMAFAVTACRSTQDGKVLFDGESHQAHLEPAGALSQLPQNLWSSTQREATAGYYYLLGEYLGHRGQLADSFGYFEAAYGLDANDSTAEKYLSTAGRVLPAGEVQTLSEKFALLYPKSASIHLMHAQVLRRRDLSSEAIKPIEAALKLEPHSLQGALQLAAVYRQLGDSHRVEAILRRFIASEPGHIGAIMLLVRFLLEQERYDEALVLTKKVYALDNGGTEVGVVFALLLARGGDVQQAATVWSKEAVRQRHDSAWMSRLALAKHYFDNKINLVDALARMIKVSSPKERPLLRLQLVFALWDADATTPASELIDELHHEDPYSNQLLFLAGLGHERLQQFDLASDFYKQIRPYTTHYIPAQLKMSGLLLAQDRWEQALEIILQLMHYRFASWEVYLQASTLYVDKKKYASAVRVLEAGFAKFPAKINLLFLQGVYTERTGDVEEAIAIMRRVVAVDASYSSAYNYMGYLYAEMDTNLDEAEKLVLTALSLKPDDGYYLDSLGWVYYRQKRYEKAIEVLSEALKQTPNEGVIAEHLAETYQAMGQPEEALQFFREAKKYFKDENDRKRVDERIHDLMP